METHLFCIDPNELNDHMTNLGWKIVMNLCRKIYVIHESVYNNVLC